MKRIQGLVIAAVVVAALAACTPTAPKPTTTPEEKPTVAASATPTPTPTPTPEPAELVVPGCDGLLTLEQAKSDFGNDKVQFIGEFGADEFGAAAEVDVARHAASPVRLCVWGIPNSDGGLSVTVGVLAEADRGALISSLTAAGYASTTMGTVTGVERAGIGESEQGGTHLFTGDVWIFVPGFKTSFTGNVAGQVLDAMRTANPTLGL